MPIVGPPRPTEDLLILAGDARNPTEIVLPLNITSSIEGRSKADGSSSQPADRRLFQVGIWPCQADKGDSQANTTV